MIIKQKIIWGMVKGDLNIEDHSIPTVVIPTIMAWFSSNKTGTKIQYHNPPLSERNLILPDLIQSIISLSLCLILLVRQVYPTTV